MDAFLTMLTRVGIFVALAVPGYLLVKLKQLKVEQSISLSKLLMWVGLPFLIVSSTTRLQFNKQMLKGICATIVIAVALIFAFFFLTQLLTKKEEDGKKSGMMSFAMTFSNNGFLGLPLAAAVIGKTTEAYLYLVIANVLTNLFMYTLGIYLITRDKSKMSFQKAIFNPVLFAFAVGILFNLVDMDARIPQVMTFVDYFEAIVAPLSMTILGMKMGGIKFTSLFTSKNTYFVSAVKLLAVPVISVTVACLTNLALGVGSALAYAIFISFAMPTAGLASTFADAYDGDSEGAVAYTLGSTILSVATIPVLYWLLCLIV